MMDRETQKPRGYGFVTYDNDATVEGLLSMDALVMDGKMVSVEPCQSSILSFSDGCKID